MIFVVSLAFLIATGTQSVLAFRYPDMTPGLAAPGPFYCNELQSSGGEDTIMIALMSVSAIPFLIRLAFFRSWPSRVEQAAFWLVALIAAAGPALAALDCAHIFYTAFVIPDRVLATILLCWAVSALLMLGAGARSFMIRV